MQGWAEPTIAIALWVPLVSLHPPYISVKCERVLKCDFSTPIPDLLIISDLPVLRLV